MENSKNAHFADLGGDSGSMRDSRYRMLPARHHELRRGGRGYWMLDAGRSAPCLKLPGGIPPEVGSQSEIPRGRQS